MVTPTALGAFINYLYGSPLVMLTKLSRPLGGENNENTETRKRQPQMAFGLSVKEQELMVLGEVTVNPGHERGSFLEKVGLSLDFQ